MLSDNWKSFPANSIYNPTGSSDQLFTQPHEYPSLFPPHSPPTLFSHPSPSFNPPLLVHWSLTHTLTLNHSLTRFHSFTHTLARSLARSRVHLSHSQSVVFLKKIEIYKW